LIRSQGRCSRYPSGRHKKGNDARRRSHFFNRRRTKRQALLGRFRRRASATSALSRRFLGGGIAVIVSAADRGRQDGQVQPFRSFRLGRFDLAGATATRTGRFRLPTLGFRLRLGRPFAHGRYRQLSVGLFGRCGETGPIAPIAVATITAITVIAIIPLLARFFTAAVAFIGALAFIRALALLLLGAMVPAAILGRVEIIAFIIIIVVGTAVALLLLLLPGAIVGQDAEIMIGELQIIFRVHPVTGHLGVPRHVLVFFKKLGRIATRAIVYPVAAVAAAPVATLGTSIIVPAAITATGLPIVDQELVLAFTLPTFTENTVQSPS